MIRRERDAGRQRPNVLTLRIQPDEGIALRFGSKVPGPGMHIRSVLMDFRFGTSFGRQTADAYERLILDAMQGDSTLFTRRDETEAADASSDTSAASSPDDDSNAPLLVGIAVLVLAIGAGGFVLQRRSRTS